MSQTHATPAAEADCGADIALSDEAGTFPSSRKRMRTDRRLRLCAARLTKCPRGFARFDCGPRNRRQMRTNRPPEGRQLHAVVCSFEQGAAEGQF